MFRGLDDFCAIMHGRPVGSVVSIIPRGYSDLGLNPGWTVSRAPGPLPRFEFAAAKIKCVINVQISFLSFNLVLVAIRMCYTLNKYFCLSDCSKSYKEGVYLPLIPDIQNNSLSIAVYAMTKIYKSNVKLHRQRVKKNAQLGHGTCCSLF